LLQNDKIVQWGEDWLVFNIEENYVKAIYCNKYDCCWKVNGVIAEAIPPKYVTVNRRQWVDKADLDRFIKLLVQDLHEKVFLYRFEAWHYAELKSKFGEMIVN